MKKIFVFIICLVIAQVASAQKDERALKILDAMSAKYQSFKSFSADFTYEQLNERQNLDEGFEGNITIMGESYRLDMGIQEIFNNGVTVWTYIPDDKEVNISDFEPEDDELTPSKIYTAYQTGYKYVLLDNESKGDIHVIDLVPEQKKDFFKVRMEIHKSSNLIKSWRIFDNKGNQFLHTITNFKSNLNVTAAYFEFNPADYPGMDVFDLR